MSPSAPMDLDRWRRIEPILDLALDLSPEERGTLLDEACADDPGLRAEVESLLAADMGAGSFLGEYDADLLAEAVEEIEADLAGQQMGPYHLLREIGTGGMGAVYEAEDTRLGRRVAVKLLPPEYSRDRKAKERFLREARAAAAVDHPNLCTIHDVGESEGRLYIVLSFYDGETLRKRIRQGPLPLAEAREIAIQVARGLARAHEAGIVHRDIKPANVMLTHRGEAKILDFGIARLGGDDTSLTRTGDSWGTPAYMAPEQARGERVDARADVWSLGVMLYEMAAGRRPFGGESMEAVVSAILTQEPEPLKRVRPGVPVELARVVERALAKDPAERYGSAAELLADLESGKMPALLPVRRRLKALGLVAGALVVLLTLTSVLVWRPWQAMAGPPLRVAILYPVVELEGNGPEPAFVASDMRDAILASLISLEGIQPLDPPEKSEDKYIRAQRLGEADEALLGILKCRDDSCLVSLHRRKANGETLKISDSFQVQEGFENAYQLAEGVQAHVQQVYSGYRLRPESSNNLVRAEDYTEYAELQRQVDRGERLGEPELDELDALLRRSSGLVSAYVLAAGIAYNRNLLDRALDYVAQAEKVAPFDPRPLFTHLRIELDEARLDSARQSLERLAGLVPGDARVKGAEADLLEAKGELEEAYVLRKELVRRRPAWRNILKLATLEFRLGASEDASRRLKDLLAAQPDNEYVWENVAAVEAVYGDLKRAAELYEKLSRTSPVPYLTGLCFVRYLLGGYTEAIAAGRRALDRQPNDIVTRFNLAISLEAQGEQAEARRIYRTLVTDLAAVPSAQDVGHSLRQAQCLVRLNQREAGSHLADKALKKRPEDVQSLFLAAQLYALLKDRTQALYYAEQALKKGLRPEWFATPECRSINVGQLSSGGLRGIGMVPSPTRVPPRRIS